MRSSTPQERRLPLTLASLMLAFGLAACVTPTKIIPVALDCAKRVPPQLADDVPGAEMPGPSVGEQIAFGDAQTGKLDQSNDEKRTVLWIFRQCEAEEREAVEKLKPRAWWKFWG